MQNVIIWIVFVTMNYYLHFSAWITGLVTGHTLLQSWVFEDSNDVTLAWRLEISTLAFAASCCKWTMSLLKPWSLLRALSSSQTVRAVLTAACNNKRQPSFWSNDQNVTVFFIRSLIKAFFRKPYLLFYQCRSEESLCQRPLAYQKALSTDVL